MNILSIDTTVASQKWKLPFWIVKITRFEFWPYWILYIPIFIYYAWLSLKSKSLAFFTATNPGIYLGGFVGESKTSILIKIKEDYLPKTLYFDEMHRAPQVLSLLAKSEMFYPIIIKPDVGERGNGVEKLYNDKMLNDYLANQKGDFIVQEFIDYETELGILYYRTPDGKKSGITSIVEKEFLSITGNGQSTVLELIQQSRRAQLRLDYLLQKFANRLSDVLPNGQKILLEPIGNHCRGTKFLNRNDLINDQLIKVFDVIAKNMEGFYIGRYDLKVSTIEDLYAGKNIKIMELNGVTSEPAHIYDPNTTLLQAYQALFLHYSLVYKIAIQNHRLGIKYVPFKVVFKALQKHFTSHK